jgi:hypothetical protein
MGSNTTDVDLLDRIPTRLQCAAAIQHGVSGSGEDKLSDRAIISNRKLPAAVFVLTNRPRCAPRIDNDGSAVGRGSINLEYR